MRLKNELDRASRQFIDAMHKLGWSEHTVRAYERGVQFFVRWLVNETAIESISAVTSETIAAWREELGRWKIAESTRNLRFAAVKTFFRLMNQAGAIDSDVAAAVAFPKRDEQRIDERPVLSQDEAKRAIASIEASSPIDLRDRAILEVLIVTGIRNSELRSLTLDDIDFIDGTLLVRCGKGKKVRIVPLGSAAAALEQYIAEARPQLAGAASIDALFVTRERAALSREALVRIVRVRAGVAPHRLRHTCATSMRDRGAQQEKIQAVLGHSSLDTTKIYVH
jgi:integrase/recombinase XerD